MTNPSKNATTDFDPFALMPLFHRARHLNSWLVALPVCAVFMSSFLIASMIDGTLGSRDGFQTWNDLKRALGLPHTPPALPYFPLMRDVTSWFLVFVVVCMCGLAHRQWQLMAHFVSDLAGNGTLRPKTTFKDTPHSRALKIDKLISAGEGHDALTSFISGVTRVSTAKIAKWAPYIGAGSVIIVILLIIGEKHSLFIVFAPHGLNSGQKGKWLSAAYQNWWASDDHPFGLLVYFMAWFVGSYILIIENLIGVIAIYQIAGLPYVAEFDIDWLNRDGNFGWMPVKRVMRTVDALLTLHGLTICILLIVIGIQNFPWIIILVVIGLIIAPMYMIVPAVVFGRVIHRARDQRIRQLTHIANQIQLATAQNVNEFRSIMFEVDRVRTAKIRPTYPGWSQTPPIVVAIVLPIVLTIAQITFSWKAG
jgi:hypothetical protein